MRCRKPSRGAERRRLPCDAVDSLDWVTAPTVRTDNEMSSFALIPLGVLRIAPCVVPGDISDDPGLRRTDGCRARAGIARLASARDERTHHNGGPRAARAGTVGWAVATDRIPRGFFARSSRVVNRTGLSCTSSRGTLISSNEMSAHFYTAENVQRPSRKTVARVPIRLLI